MHASPRTSPIPTRESESNQDSHSSSQKLKTQPDTLQQQTTPSGGVFQLTQKERERMEQKINKELEMTRDQQLYLNNYIQVTPEEIKDTVVNLE